MLLLFWPINKRFDPMARFQPRVRNRGYGNSSIGTQLVSASECCFLAKERRGWGVVGFSLGSE